MKYIDKNRNRQQGEGIVSEFLDCFHARRNAYPDDMYSAFSREIDDAHDHVRFLDRLKNEVLIPEQQGHCCYCMRNLNSCHRVTVEHIMPNHAVNTVELDQYRLRPTPLDGLPHSDDFKSMNPMVYPPHPHSIAYQNLVLSCDGDFFHENTRAACCNLKRRHQFVPPLVLYPEITETFVYRADGWAEWTEDPQPPHSVNNAMRILGLNNGVLRMIRRIWFFCQDQHLEPQEQGKEIIVNTLMGYLDPNSTTESEIQMLANFKKEKYWNLLLQYEAFANIPHG